MQISNTKLVKTSESNIVNDCKYNPDRISSQDSHQIICCLKDAVFSKYISDYFIEKLEQMWILFEKRIEEFIDNRHLNITCNHIRPQVLIRLEELSKFEQEQINAYKRNLEILCSLHKQTSNDDKYSVQVQSTQHPPTSYTSIRVPKTPRCIDRSEITNDIYENNTDELSDLENNDIFNQETKPFSVNVFQDHVRHCIFQYGKILPLDPHTKTRTIRIAYSCNSNNNNTCNNK